MPRPSTGWYGRGGGGMSRRVARYALLTALAMVLSWLESAIPLSAAAPGMKL